MPENDPFRNLHRCTFFLAKMYKVKNFAKKNYWKKLEKLALGQFIDITMKGVILKQIFARHNINSSRYNPMWKDLPYLVFF